MKTFLYKFLLVMLMVMFIVQPIFAGGGKEDGKSQTSTSTSSGASDGVSPSPGTINTGTPSTISTPEKKWLVSDGNGGTREVDYVSADIVPAGAIGYKIYKDNGDIDFEYMDEAESWLGAWIGDIAKAIDQIVFRIALAIHPFPVSMFQLYELTTFRNNLHGVDLTMSPTEDNIHSFDTDYLLISNKYYNSRHLDINRTSGSSLNGWKLPIAEGEGLTEENMFQFTKWKTIVMLFATCFAAEILFMAIYGYATGSSEDGDSSLMKNVAKKIAITVMLMVLVSALPFLLEAFRIGLFEIAESFYGEAAYKSYSELAGAGIISSLDIPVDQNGRLKDANIFRLPGLFLQSMRDMFARTTSDPMDRSLSKQVKNIGDSKIRSLLVKGFVWILIVVYRFLMFFVALKATIHIAKNVLEVYLLLSLVMILIPFSVFTPLKTLGSKCVMSLVSNLVECFIILVIILTIIPAIKITIVTLLDYSIELSIAGTSMIDTLYYKSWTDPPYHLKMIAGDGYVAVLAHTGVVGNKIGICWTFDKKGYSSIPELKKIFDAENVWVVMDISKIAGDPTRGGFKGLTKDHVLEAKEIHTPIVEGNYTLSYDDYVITVAQNGGAASDETDKIYLLPTENTKNDMWRYTLAGQFASAMYESEAILYNWAPDMPNREDRLQSIWNKMLNPSGEEGKYDIIIYTLACLLTPFDVSNVTFTKDAMDDSDPSSEVIEYTNSGILTDNEVTSAMFLQLTLVFLGLFLPSYFVQQSTQITNALMNGTAGMESLANAMEHTMSKAVGLTGRLLSMPFSIAGNVAHAALGGKPEGGAASKGNEQTTLSSMTDPNG